MYKRKNIQFLDILEMMDLLKNLSRRYIYIKGKKPTAKPFSNCAYYEDNEVNFSITFKKANKVCTYMVRKDGDELLQLILGGDGYRILKQYTGKNGIYDLRKNDFDMWKKLLGWDTERKKFVVSAKPILYNNKKYNKTRNYAYGYDINSSYPYAMIQDMPDTTVKPKMYVKLGANELGFYIDNGELICTEEIGKLCDFVFPRIESPFKRFVEVWYNRKKNAKTKKDKMKAKEILNFSIGYLQKVNPFIRARIISFANKVISDLIDENTLLCSTDSIISLIERKDINIGVELGQFKEEKQGLFAYKDMNYQWNLETPKYRGVSKNWFKPGWDILVDKTPITGNVVNFNPTTGLFEEA